MSQDGSADSNSHSESSGSSPSQTPFFQDHFFKDSNSTTDMTDLTLIGSPAPTFTRTPTVRRVSSAFLKKEKGSLNMVNSNDQYIEERTVEDNSILNQNAEQIIASRYRKSLDTTFRHSLDSISEHKTRRSFSPTLLTATTVTSRECSSIDSSSSEQTENALRSSSDTAEEKEKTIQSPSSSYMTWIDSVNSEFFGSAASNTEVTDVDNNKVGEWNNFWLNYNNARGQYLSSSYLSAEDKMPDDVSEVKSTCSTQRELTDKNSDEYITLTLEEIQEAVKCTQRITDILQNALRRSDQDTENLIMENSYYSESFSRQNSSAKVREDPREVTREDIRKYARDRSMSYAVTSAELLKQKEMLKPGLQSSSTSCINALLNTGVADILKRVINKRRDVISPDDVRSSLTRSSFSEWSGK